MVQGQIYKLSHHSIVNALISLKQRQSGTCCPSMASWRDSTAMVCSCSVSPKSSDAAINTVTSSPSCTACNDQLRYTPVAFRMVGLFIKPQQKNMLPCRNKWSFACVIILKLCLAIRGEIKYNLKADEVLNGIVVQGFRVANHDLIHLLAIGPLSASVTHIEQCYHRSAWDLNPGPLAEDSPCVAFDLGQLDVMLSKRVVD